MIYVYRQTSKSAHALVDAIRDEGCEVTRWKNFSDAVPKKGDLVVNWGAYIERWPVLPGVDFLNKHTLGDKFEELKRINKAGVDVPHFSSTKPNTGQKWLARKHAHVEADDLRAELSAGEYYTKWLDIDLELRAHVFKGEVIQMQFKKAVKPNAHKWIRCWATGWDWKNGAEDFTPAMRKAAIQAVAAVGYDFGAVDIGRLRDGDFVVLEVNSSPGFDVGGTTCYKYANAIIASAKD